MKRSGSLGAVVVGFGALGGFGQCVTDVKSLLLDGAPKRPIDYDSVFKRTLGEKGLKYYSKTTMFTMCAAIFALEDARMDISGHNADEIGIILGSSCANFESCANFYETALTQGYRYVNPMLYPNTMPTTVASQAAIRLGLKGPNKTISSGNTSAIEAISYATEFIKSGRAKAMLAGGADEIGDMLKIGLDADGCYDEGAVLLVLENYESAAQRDADVRCEILGGTTCYLGKRNGEAALEVMSRRYKALLELAGIGFEDIEYVVSNADASDGGLLKRLLNDSVRARFGPTPEFIASEEILRVGDCFAVSGALQVFETVLKLQNERKRYVLLEYAQQDGERSALLMKV
jgi:3-oxoacyl-[acyl-carrier-protein] synthase II